MNCICQWYIFFTKKTDYSNHFTNVQSVAIFGRNNLGFGKKVFYFVAKMFLKITVVATFQKFEQLNHRVRVVVKIVNNNILAGYPFHFVNHLCPFIFFHAMQYKCGGYYVEGVIFKSIEIFAMLMNKLYFRMFFFGLSNHLLRKIGTYGFGQFILIKC